MSCTIQSILSKHLEAYAKGHRLPSHQWKAAKALMHCRTATLGGHVQRCEAGHIVGVWFNSCRHRHCPRCNALKNERWLERQREKLLACAHRHVVFTIPSELRVVFRLNEALFTDAMFDAVRETMLTLVRDEQHVGGTPGLMLARHTWSRSLALHPHIHCLVSEGALSKDGCWVAPKRRCFLPARVVMSLYRGKLLHRLRALLEEGELELPQTTSARGLRAELYRLSKLDWNVRVGERYGHGVGVATYLARYLNGGPVRESQLRRVDGENLVFRYTTHRAGPAGARHHRMRLTPEQFIERYLMHVPQHRRRMLRCAGLYAGGAKARLDQAREQLGQPPVKPPEPIEWTAFVLKHAPEALRCPRCASPLRRAEFLAPVRAPPRGSIPKWSH